MLLNIITKLSMKTLDIIGGEPTLHADIVRFVREAKQRGLHVNISSNGTNIEILKDIQRVGDEITVGISINDRDTFNHLKKFVLESKPIVKTLYGLGTDLTLITDILQLHPKNFFLIYRDVMGNDELHAVIPFFRFMSSAQQKFYAASNISTVYCSGFLPDKERHPELATVRCPAGTTKLGVMPDGSVYPCNLFFGRKEFSLGNILHDAFDRIWRHRALGFFRTFAGNRCPHKSCEFHMQCHGGCPAHALFLTGDIAAPDPRCS
jgi:radical SAM protein with 4Fe4S-binding SPASM domain